MRKIAVESDIKIDSLGSIYYCVSFPEIIGNDSLMQALAETCKSPQQTIIEFVRSLERIESLVENYKQTRGKQQHPQLVQKRNASLAEASISKIWAVLITIVLIILLIFLIIFLAELL